MTKDHINEKPFAAECEPCDRTVRQWLPLEEVEGKSDVWLRCNECGQIYPAT